MRLETYLMQQPMVQRYAHKYSAPLIRYYEQAVPDRYMKKWLTREDTSVDNVATYYLGVLNKHPDMFVAILAMLERNDLFTVPVEPGIMHPDYWERWAIDNAIALLDARDSFIYGKGEVTACTQ